MKNLIDKFFTWCSENKLNVKVNNEVHMVNSNTFFKTDFVINNKIFVKVSDASDMTTINIYKNFSKSFGTLIVLPEDLINNLDKVSRRDIEKKFDIKF